MKTWIAVVGLALAGCSGRSAPVDDRPAEAVVDAGDAGSDPEACSSDGGSESCVEASIALVRCCHTANNYGLDRPEAWCFELDAGAATCDWLQQVDCGALLDGGWCR